MALSEYTLNENTEADTIISFSYDGGGNVIALAEDEVTEYVLPAHYFLNMTRLYPLPVKIVKTFNGTYFLMSIVDFDATYTAVP